MNTPWGRSQTVEDLGDGVKSVSTASHGGYKLDSKANAKVPEYMRHEDGWYEEDVDWSIVAVVFPHLFDEKAMRHAEATLRNWRPDAWEKFFGMRLEPGQSRRRDEQEWNQAHKDSMVAISASGNSSFAKVPDGMVLVTATRGGVRGRGGERCFLVPEEEYRAERPFSFVVDEARHSAVNCPW